MDVSHEDTGHMEIDYKLRCRNGGALFKIRSAELHRRLQYLDQKVAGGISTQQRTDTRPGVEDTETIYVLDGTDAETGGHLVAIERHDECRLQGHASLMSEPAATSPPRSPEALIAFAEKAKNGGNYDAANAAFALALYTRFPRLDCSLTVRETPKTPKGTMTNGYYDLAYIGASAGDGDFGSGCGPVETCIPVPMLQGDVAYWFAAHADRREPMEHGREPSGAGPTIEDLEAMHGRAVVREAVLAVLTADALDQRYVE